MRVILLLLIPMLGAAKTIELGFPDLQHRVKVVLPDDHDPAKKYPALLYYHGQGGEPDTSMMLHQTGSKRWIVVGMAYYQLGKFTMTKETLAKEMTLLRSVRRHLQTKYGMDPARCYVAGFSKGGWLADLFLQADDSLAGGVLLGAGHLHQYRKTPVKYRNQKPVFIGVGRLDGNYPFSLKGLLHHRKMGARTTFDVWPELAHAFPRDGSESLSQWLALESMVKPSLTDDAVKEMDRALVIASKLPDATRWRELKRIWDLPYSKLMGETWNKDLTASIEKLEASDPVKSEAAALVRHRKLLYQEITDTSLQGLVKVHTAYQELAESVPGTVQAKYALHDHNRTAFLIKHFQEQKKTAREKKKDPFKPLKPKQPENNRRFPTNPLVK